MSNPTDRAFAANCKLNRSSCQTFTSPAQAAPPTQRDPSGRKLGPLRTLNVADGPHLRAVQALQPAVKHRLVIVEILQRASATEESQVSAWFSSGVEAQNNGDNVERKGLATNILAFAARGGARGGGFGKCQAVVPLAHRHRANEPLLAGN